MVFSKFENFSKFKIRPYLDVGRGSTPIDVFLVSPYVRKIVIWVYIFAIFLFVVCVLESCLDLLFVSDSYFV